MKPIDRFGLDLDRVHYLQPNEFNRELFYLEATRKVRADNTFSYQGTRHEAPIDLRGSTITIRYDRADPTRPPIAYHGGQRHGPANPLDFLANDRRPQTGRQKDTGTGSL